jgi:hypothetical protein
MSANCQELILLGTIASQRLVHPVIGKAEILKPLRDVHSATLRQPAPTLKSYQRMGGGGNVLPAFAGGNIFLFLPVSDPGRRLKGRCCERSAVVC